MSPVVSFRIRVSGAEREIVIAELGSLGTLGIEEHEDHLLAYFCDASVSLRQLAQLQDVEIGAPELVPEVDWEREWRAGLEPRRLGGLWLRPSWCETRGEPEIQIEPEQAFGSGEHASTRLALELVLERLQPGDRVLDLGTGSGILSLGALRMGAASALGIEIDPQACRNATDNATRNFLPLWVVCGTLDLLVASARFEIVVANMLLERLDAWIPRLASHTLRVLVVSGYLAEERARLRDRLSGCGLGFVTEVDEPQLGDLWCASLWAQTRVLQSSSRSSSVRSKG